MTTLVVIVIVRGWPEQHHQFDPTRLDTGPAGGDLIPLGVASLQSAGLGRPVGQDEEATLRVMSQSESDESRRVHLAVASFTRRNVVGREFWYCSWSWR